MSSNGAGVSAAAAAADDDDDDDGDGVVVVLLLTCPHRLFSRSIGTDVRFILWLVGE